MDNADSKWYPYDGVQADGDERAADSELPVSILYVNVEERGSACIVRGPGTLGLLGMAAAYMNWLSDQIDGVRRTIERAA